jgi:hypothetical protein
MSFLLCFAVSLILVGAMCYVVGAIATLLAEYLGDEEPDDSFDLAVEAMNRLQFEAWHAIGELRQLDRREVE